MNQEKIQVLWEKIRQMATLLESKSSEIRRLNELNQHLEEKLRAKESDLSQLKMLYANDQQVFTQGKKEIEDRIQNLMGKIDTLTSD